MNETMTMMMTLGLAGVAGMVLGLVFFCGLWWTVRRSVASSQPGAWVFGSALLRIGGALGGFYAVSGGQFQPLLACLAGFLLARLGVTWLTRLPRPARQVPPAQEARHAP